MNDTGGSMENDMVSDEMHRPGGEVRSGWADSVK